MIGILCAEAVFLAAAGLAKLARPSGTSEALRVGPVVVRIFALIEVAVAAAVLLLGGRVASGLFAVTFAVLAAAAARIAANQPGSDCGCFGAVRAPASHWHTLVNVGCAGTGVVGVFLDPPSFAAEVSRQPLLGIPFVAAVGLLAWLCYVLVTALPALWQARAEVVGSP